MLVLPCEKFCIWVSGSIQLSGSLWHLLQLWCFWVCVWQTDGAEVVGHWFPKSVKHVSKANSSHSHQKCLYKIGLERRPSSTPQWHECLYIVSMIIWMYDHSHCRDSKHLSTPLKQVWYILGMCLTESDNIWAPNRALHKTAGARFTMFKAFVFHLQHTYNRSPPTS